MEFKLPLMLLGHANSCGLICLVTGPPAQYSRCIIFHLAVRIFFFLLDLVFEEVVPGVRYPV